MQRFGNVKQFSYYCRIISSQVVMEEIWKDIPEYEGYYQVSNLGNFRSLPRIIKYKSSGTRKYPSKYLLTETTKDNYQRIVLMKEGIKTRFQAHRLVALAFIPNPENKLCINHIDGNKSNNVVSNLEWCTYSENTIHAINTGLIDMSKHHPSNSKMIKCIETNKIFTSYSSACKWLGKTSTSISCLRRGVEKGRKTLGYHWELIN